MTADDGQPVGTGGGPAAADPPSGYGESSWWPVVVVIGAVGVYAGVGLVILARPAVAPVSPLLGPVVLVAGVGLLVAGLLGWTYHAYVHRYREGGAAGAAGRFRWGMGLFLCAEAATFGAGLGYYGYVRAGPWPPGHLPDVLTSLVAVNTAVLAASSVTLHLAHGALGAGRRRRFVGLLVATVLLGATFLVGQAVEYVEFVVGDGFTVQSGVYGSAFFGLTGLHGLHVGLGLVLLVVVLGRALHGQYSAERHVSVTTVSMYWHFVDAVWLVLVTVLYVGAVAFP